jgi:membrane-associated protease RseP (regulator of RpoE activity)
MDANTSLRTFGRAAFALWLATAAVTGFIALGGAGADGDKGTSAPVKGKPAVVPFEMLDSNHMVVNAKLNGKGPYRLIFDLGAPITLIGNKAAEGSGAVKADAPKSFLFAMRGEATMKTLEVGDLKTTDLPVVVFDHPLLKALSGFLGRPLDGIIGFTFFARYKTTIDYQAKVMTFEPVDYKVGDLMKTLPDRLAGPKEAKEIVLAPLGVWGLKVGPAKGSDPGRGVTILTVAPDSPAALAGLRPGDLLMTLDGRWTTTVVDAYAAASKAEPGRAIDVVVLRDGKEIPLSVTPRPGF